MAKYSFELKLKIVKAYLEGKGGYNRVAKMFGIPQEIIVRRWVNAYKTLGEDGLKRKKSNSSYSVQFKVDVLNYMSRTEKSVQETANHYGLNNPTLINNWKIKWEKYGIIALSKAKGCPTLKNKSTKQEKKLTREQELEHEVELLKAELAFIKKLQALGMDIPERLKTKSNQE
ncbi:MULTISPECIES: helix-turn-helix domain-containing protein [unclassified Clostridium]|uniref:helix-turn-helix domain-containing protein n=1 Tax=unclassified Clostridium TaxID=2614128 RepID=UPI0025BA0C76|nr:MULTISPECIES: transposase [unclassified Clostridium]